jgi:hypothetical protein
VCIDVLLAQFANEDDLDFNDASDREPTQEFIVVQSREVGDYAVKSVISCMTFSSPGSLIELFI